jgi:hypothetical protein
VQHAPNPEQLREHSSDPALGGSMILHREQQQESSHAGEQCKRYEIALEVNERKSAKS